MQLAISSIVAHDEIESLRTVLSQASFADGRKSAGWSAALVKKNEQAVIDPAVDDAASAIAVKLMAHPVFELAARPRNLIKYQLSRYRPGMAYGTHVDNAVMDGERTDVSFTLFLSDPDSYGGGELVIETASGEEAIKLPAGSAFIYPSGTLHRVEEVTHGERLAMVGWVRSLVRDAAKRELLFDLESARRKLFDAQGKTPEFDLLSKTTANLLRMWVDT